MLVSVPYTTIEERDRWGEFIKKSLRDNGIVQRQIYYNEMELIGTAFFYYNASRPQNVCFS